MSHSVSVVSAPPAPSASPLSPATASSEPRDTDGFRSSGQSPGRRSLHLVGPGAVGRAFLRQLADVPVNVVAVTDSSGTVFDRAGLPLEAIAAHKEAGRPLSAWPGAEALPTDFAVTIVNAEIVVDATPSTSAGTADAVLRGRNALRNRAVLVLCAKNALAAAAPEWLLGSAGRAGRVGIDAVLGGAGSSLVRELDELRAHCVGLAIVGNVTTSAIVDAIERGASLDGGIAAAREAGLLEPDPTLDLDGSDAAVKLLAVWGAVFGETAAEQPSLAAVLRQDVRSLDPDLLRERARRGVTTRLVGRGSRGGADLRVAFEEVRAGSPLAAPPDRVVYGYELPSGLRVHTGLAVGHQRTAAALVDDVRRLLRAEVRS